MNYTGGNPNYVRSTVDPYMAYLASGKGYEEQTVETEDTTTNAAKEENEEPVEIIEQQEEVIPVA
ncbi:hypothetical protein SAMN02910384_03014 [Pseudobutyrivibrio sp. ACV-2]|uniref:hypothetical protein n=1 Tax=Pseudobutyrivibrio sp. ACV-2 TaxID=1520801 RepID=UPI00089D6398|nr:hypothetical protein [Pseudobutyrivibrio sp. ACV-2]SEA99913.1 hypothetical protein SAMN02910384_03014 [Pseudobutyrivibrio sp. ACV-2]